MESEPNRCIACGRIIPDGINDMCLTCLAKDEKDLEELA